MADMADFSQINNELEQLRAKTEIRADWPYNRHPLFAKDGSPAISQVIDKKGEAQNFAIWLERNKDGKFENFVLLNKDALDKTYYEREPARPDAGQANAISVNMGEMVYRRILRDGEDNATHEIPANTVETAYYKPDTGEIIGRETDENFTQAFQSYWTGADAANGKDDILVSAPEAERQRLEHINKRENALRDGLPDPGDFPINAQGNGVLRQVKSAIVPKSVTADGKLSSQDLQQAIDPSRYVLDTHRDVVHSADSQIKAKAEPVLIEFIDQSTKAMRVENGADFKMQQDYVVTQSNITFGDLPTQTLTVQTEPVSVKPAAAAAQNDAFLDDLKSRGQGAVGMAGLDPLQQRLVNKAMLEVKVALKSDPSASGDATQSKIAKALGMAGLNEQAKATVAALALEKIQGTQQTPNVAQGFNQSSTGIDGAAVLHAKQVELQNMDVGDGGRAAALETARNFISGKTNEVKTFIDQQSPEIAAQARQVMNKIDDFDSERLDALIHDVAAKAKIDISQLSQADIERVKVTAKSLVADGLKAAGSPENIERAIQDLDINKIVQSAANKSLQGLEDVFSKAPTPQEAVNMAAQAYGSLADKLGEMRSQQQAEIQRIKDMEANDPAAYKDFCEKTTLPTPAQAIGCAAYYDAPKL